MSDMPCSTDPAPPPSRRRFLALAGGTGVGGMSLLLAACGGSDKKSGSAATTPRTSTRGTLDVVAYALTLEHLEADFYDKVVASGLLRGAELDLAKRFGEEEHQHVEALTATVKQLGGSPATAPKTKFPLKGRKQVLELAATVENLGAAAYLGAAGMIEDPKVLAAALSIHSVEGRHAAALNRAIGKSPTPDGAFAKGASMAEVLAKVKPFIAS